MSKSAVRVAREALAVGRQAPSPYSSRFSRHDYTQPQLFALLILKQFLRTDYRGLVTLLAEWSEVRRALGLRKVPHYSTLCYAEQRLLTGAQKGGTFLCAQQAVLARAKHKHLIVAAAVAAVDATGFEARHVSLYYRVRSGETKRAHRRRRAWPKLTAVVDTYLHLIAGAVTGIGPTQDSPDFTPAMRQAAGMLPIDIALADAGYDAEHNHRLCREELGVRRTVIKLNPRNRNRRWPRTAYRREMRQGFPMTLYHQRWHARVPSAGTNADSAPI